MYRGQSEYCAVSSCPSFKPAFSPLYVGKTYKFIINITADTVHLSALFHVCVHVLLTLSVVTPAVK
jgi:hypothetical protein